MSIINQMLRDLDARHASHHERAGLPSGLRTLPPEQPRGTRPGLMLAAGLLAGGIVAWLWLGFGDKPAVPPMTPRQVLPENTPPAQVVAPAPRAAETLEASAKPQPEPVPAPAAPPARPVAAVPATPAGASVPAEAAPAPRPVAQAAVAPVAKPAAPPVSHPEATARTEAPAPPPPAAAPQIEKQPKGNGVAELAETEYRRGMQAAANGDVAAAVPALRHVLELDPRHAKARQALLSVLASSRQWDEVKQVAQAGLALDPARSGWATILARIQHEQGDIAGALETLERHAAPATADADFQGLFAFLLHKRQRPAEAAQHYQAALALKPNEGRWWYGLGLALEASGRGEEAKSAYAKARESANLPADLLGIIEQKLR